MKRDGSQGRRRSSRQRDEGQRAQQRPGPDLGLGRRIPRRDFLQGTLIGAASLLSGEWLSGAPAWAAGPQSAAAAGPAPQDLPGYYPPALTGMRGSAAGT